MPRLFENLRALCFHLSMDFVGIAVSRQEQERGAKQHAVSIKHIWSYKIVLIARET